MTLQFTVESIGVVTHTHTHTQKLLAKESNASVTNNVRYINVPIGDDTLPV